MFTITGKSRFPGFQVGQYQFGGFVYKTWNGGKNGRVVMAQDWRPFGSSLTQWQNGFCESAGGTSPTPSTTDGLGNTKTLFDSSDVSAGQCTFIAGYNAWNYTRVDFSRWFPRPNFNESGNFGYGDWWLPAYDELQELYDLGNMPSPTSGDGGYYWSSTSATPIPPKNAGFALSFSTGTWTKFANTDSARIRLIREF
jgi:hypothetical protein